MFLLIGLISSPCGTLIEVFEASPASKHVLASHILEWDFPGSAVLLPPEVFDHIGFQDQLAGFRKSFSSLCLFSLGANLLSYGCNALEPAS